MFQHTAARRRLANRIVRDKYNAVVSTHSRPKAAGRQNSQMRQRIRVSTHSRPKAAGGALIGSNSDDWGFNTQPPEGGWKLLNVSLWLYRLFQHTAARRRLDISRFQTACQRGFNTQPPEGGWWMMCIFPRCSAKFQHTAARRRLG